MTQRAGGGARWLLVAAVVTVAIVLLWGVQTGSCPDDAGGGGDGACTSGPAVGVPGAWVLTIGGGLFVAYALRRGYRALRHRPST